MIQIILLATLVSYFGLLMVVSRRTSRLDGTDNATFFAARRRAPWLMVAFGMIGASVSGVSLVSVPGWVGTTHLTYLQMCMGFAVGYVLVAMILLPVFYRLGLTSIYAYLGQRYGVWAHRTGALFFVLSKLTGAAARLYLACLVLHEILLADLGVPFEATTAIILVLIWAYTRRSGIATIVRTDAIQTASLLIAMVMLLGAAASALGLDAMEVWDTIRSSDLGQVWEWDGASRQNFWRQFVSGIFVVVVMTGLDQDMMQKNLACASKQDAQKDMCLYGLAFLPVNALLLVLGVLLYILCSREGIALPESSDRLLPMLVRDGWLGEWVVIPFGLGVVAAAFSSADSAMTALTTSICIDLLGIKPDDCQPTTQRRTRRRVHMGVLVAFMLCISAFRIINSTNAIDAIYVMASYTYGPLLGLYAFGLLTKVGVCDCLVPIVAVASPIITALLDYFAPIWWNYHFGYELLMFNGLMTALGLALIRRRSRRAAVAHRG